MGSPRLDTEEVRSFCQRWKIRELSLFGSQARRDATEGSDVDLLVTFADDAEWSLVDHSRMEAELETILGRDVDLVTRRSIERSKNWVRRAEILNDAEPVYVEG